MAPGRSLKALASRRRRTEGDEEDDETLTVADDSQSDGSDASDLDQHVDADHSDMSDTDTTEPIITDSTSVLPNGNDDQARPPSKRTRKSKKGKDHPSSQSKPPAFVPSADTEVMLNGFNAGDATQPVVDFEDTLAQEESKPNDTSTESSQATTGRRPDTVADRRKKEHDEYKKKRDTDPTFIPNRGNFFMHDPRTPDQRGFSSYGRGRGRGRGGFVGGPFAPAA